MSTNHTKLVQLPGTIRRHSAPTVYDHAAQGTKCIVHDELLYIQMSSDEDNPNWVLEGPYKE
jgi:hypothetical protein